MKKVLSLLMFALIVFSPSVLLTQSAAVRVCVASRSLGEFSSVKVFAASLSMQALPRGGSIEGIPLSMVRADQIDTAVRQQQCQYLALFSSFAAKQIEKSVVASRIGGTAYADPYLQGIELADDGTEVSSYRLFKAGERHPIV
jgi:hypothetical protein